MIVFDPCEAASPAAGSVVEFPVGAVTFVGLIEARLFVEAGGLAVTGFVVDGEVLVTVGVSSFVGVVVLAGMKREVAAGFEVVEVLPLGAELEIAAEICAEPDVAFSVPVPDPYPVSVSGSEPGPELEPGGPSVLPPGLLAPWKTRLRSSSIVLAASISCRV